ncbi:MAG: hypothetical protein ACRCWC_09955, partial [Plesiomonas shigelloides]
MVAQSSLDELDNFTGYKVTVASDHSYIHQGIGFTVSGVSTSIAAAGTYVLSFVTPADKYIHWRPTGLSSTANVLQMRLAEDSTVTGGTAVTPRNRNRISGNVAKTLVNVGVTLSTEGNILFYGQVGSGSNAANATGGSNDGSAEEWVLKRNTTYSLRFENIGTVTATFAHFNLF